MIAPILPELRRDGAAGTPLAAEYSSADGVMSPAEVRQLLVERKLMVGQDLQLEGEFLR